MSLRSLANIFTTAAAPDTYIAWEQNTRYTRQDFLQAVTAQYNALLPRHEQRWLLVNDNSYQFAVSFFALLAAGKHIVLPPNTQSGTLASLTDFFDADFSTLTLSNADNTNTTALEHITLNLDALTVTLLTSGSTGAAKAIAKPLRCFDAEIHALETLWGEQLIDASIFSTVSHQHIYGLLFRVLWPLCTGRAFAAAAHSYPEQLVNELLQHPRSILIASPSQLKRFPTSVDLSSLQGKLCAVFSSGGLLPTEAAQDWQQRWGQYPIEVLGSTETGGVAWRQQNTREKSWQTLPSVQIQIDAEQQLFVQSPFTGAKDFLAMGDCASLLDAQHFHLLGRSDRIVKIEEKRLSLTAMEQHLQSSPWITEASVLVLPQNTGRLGVVAALSPEGKHLLSSQNKNSLTQHLRDHLHQQFERILLPRKWRFVETMPTDPQGKISHTVLCELFNESAMQIKLILDSENQRVLQIHFPKNSTLFAGHFPELPILPGVVQFDIAVRQCSHWYALTQFRSIDKLKFSEPIVPNDTVTLSLQNVGAGKVQFNYSMDEQALSSGYIVFAS
ncbi:MAG: AMP-binding protein [Pseudomonadales bacterium]